jgi:hypothetical protein
MAILWGVVPLAFIAFGAVLLLLPIRFLLWLDLNAYYSHYTAELDASHDKKLATAKMAAVYRAFGFCSLAMGLAGLFVVLWYGLDGR